jgi:DsbE subfamily thiol:disulfide oxidoreductase
VALVLVVLVIGFTLLLATRPPIDATAVHSPLLGTLAPDFTATSIDGGRVSLHNERGNIVVLNFWASWCAPCKQESPNLSSFAWAHRGQHVKVVGVVYNDTVASARSFARYYGALFPSVADPQGAIAFHYGVTAPPTTFVIDRSGRVVATLVGPASQGQLNAIVSRVS